MILKSVVKYHRQVHRNGLKIVTEESAGHLISSPLTLYTHIKQSDLPPCLPIKSQFYRTFSAHIFI
jgi:hypothetical protein